MTTDPLIACYANIGWPVTWDVLATIALVRHVEETVARLPWEKLPAMGGFEEDGSALLVYYERKPAIAVEEIVNNAGTCLRVPMQSAHQ